MRSSIVVVVVAVVAVVVVVAAAVVVVDIESPSNHQTAAPNPEFLDVHMCFAPHRRALLGHLNFQKRSEPDVFCTYWLPNVLRITMACTFSTSQLPNVLHTTTACTFSTSKLPKVLRTWCLVYIFTSICALRHKGKQFFLSHLASWLLRPPL